VDESCCERLERSIDKLRQDCDDRWLVQTRDSWFLKGGVAVITFLLGGGMVGALIVYVIIQSIEKSP
jgi:hypothetical protein